MTEPLLTKGLTLIGRYTVMEFIGQGGMQQVYSALDSAFNRQVALKVPKNVSAEKRFERSARLSARVTQANVARTLDYFVVENRPYLVEEYIQGKDLQALLDEDFESFDPHLASFIVHRLAKGMSASHHADVFHRDLKPSNIMIVGKAKIEDVKITDFGIAKMAEEEIAEAVEGGESSITGSQTMMGALPYMSPEMVETPREAGKPADVWGLGAILFRLLCGKVPFGAGLRAVPRIVEAVVPNCPPFLSEKRQYSDLNAELWSVITACLKKRADERPTADDLVERCSQLCYSDAQRVIGNISEYRAGTGNWGYIHRGNGGERVFFHLDSYYGKAPKNGTKVCYVAHPGTPSKRAHPVLPMKSQE